MTTPTPDEFQEIKSLTTEYLAAATTGIQHIREDLRGAAGCLRREGYTRWANTLLNIEQSFTDPGSYRRLP
jgi:hypothetical protein